MRHDSLLLLPLVFVLAPVASLAHPMGNFSVNHYTKIGVSPRSIEIGYLVDMAEIPTFQEMRRFDITSQADDAGASGYLDRQARLLKAGLSLERDGQSLQLETVSRHLEFADGAGGLPTMKLAFVFRGKLDAAAGAHRLSYLDNNFPGRAGWKEIVVAANGVTILDSSAPATDRSHELTAYSSDALNSPPQQLSALVGYRCSLSEPVRSASAPKPPKHNRPAVVPIGSNLNAPSAPHAAAQSVTVRSGNTPRSRFTELISTQGNLSLWLLFSSALIAAGLGALHALEPGHGKTVVAAYLVGSRGTASHAVLLGIVVTAAHTAGVYLLGVLTLYASRYIVPEQLYPWLGAISGLSVAGLGVFTFIKRWTGEAGEHSHAPGDRHSHWFLSMFRPAPLVAPAHSAVAKRSVSLRELFMLGVTGGIVPCPAALVVLLSAFSLHRIGFGLFLIAAFSFGLAAVLVVVGLTMVYAKRAVSSRVRGGNAAIRYLPILSSAFMVMLGVGITLSAMASAHIAQGLLSKDKLFPFVTVILLGLFLGMRHSTDPDHVVAVSTIVSRQQSIRGSAAIGLLWGVGHTLTIFLVGSAIIVFGVVIPPRLGLSMEFCVALMLVLLGVLNLTGVMRWVTERLTLGKATPADPQPSAIGSLGIYQTIRPLVVGLVHGLAGSAAVALLVLSTIKSPLWSTAYLLVFGVGTMAGMMLMTAAISVPLVYTGKRFFKINRRLTAISGLASVAFGIFLVYRIGFVDGLFTSQVHWIPQ
jgi:nickel/cobalt exporter